MRANRLKELREKKGISQGELEKQIGLSQSSVSKYETETREIGVDLAIEFADYFGVTLDYFFKRDTEDRYELILGDGKNNIMRLEVNSYEEWIKLGELLDKSGYTTKIYKK